MRTTLLLCAALLLACAPAARADGDAISGSLVGTVESGQSSRHVLEVPQGTRAAYLIVAADFDAVLTLTDEQGVSFSDDDSADNLMPVLYVVNNPGLGGSTVTAEVTAYGETFGSYVLLYAYEVDGWTWFWACEHLTGDTWQGNLGDSYWAYDTSAADAFRVELGSATFDPLVRVEAHPDGAWIDDDGGQGPNASLEVETGGRAVLRCFPQSLDEDPINPLFVMLIGARGEMSACEWPGTGGRVGGEAGAVAPTPTTHGTGTVAPLALGETVTGTSSLAASAAYTFDAESAGLLAVALRGEDGDDLILALHDETGLQIAREDGDWGGQRAHEQAALLVPRAGRFELRVDVLSAQETQARFSLSAGWTAFPALEVPPDPDGTPATATPLSVGDQVDDAIDGGGGDASDWFRIEATRAGTFTVVTRAPEGDLKLELFSAADLDVPAETSDQDMGGVPGNESITVSSPAGATYYVRVLPYSTTSGLIPYQLRVGFIPD
jgi:hypothetical protein